MENKHTPGPWTVNSVGFVGPDDIDGDLRWKSGNDVIAKLSPFQ